MTIEYIYTNLTTPPSDGILVLLLYWLPLVFCVFGYFMRTWRNYQKDVARRDDPNPSGWGYVPTDTLGTLIGRALITILPFGNVCAAIFDLGPYVFGKFFWWIGELFSQPLVPDTAEAKARRASLKR